MSQDGPDRCLFQDWVAEHFGRNNRTKTITAEKYDKICNLVAGQDSNNSNAKFRFWVRSKGFRLLYPDGSNSVGQDLDTGCFDIGQPVLYVEYRPRKTVSYNFILLLIYISSSWLVGYNFSYSRSVISFSLFSVRFINL